MEGTRVMRSAQRAPSMGRRPFMLGQPPFDAASRD